MIRECASSKILIVLVWFFLYSYLCALTVFVITLTAVTPSTTVAPGMYIAGRPGGVSGYPRPWYRSVS